MKGKLPLFLILSGAVAALLSAFVILYFNMIGVEPAFFKAFYTDLVPHRAIVPLLLLSLLGGWILLRKTALSSLQARTAICRRIKCRMRFWKKAAFWSCKWKRPFRKT